MRSNQLCSHPQMPPIQSFVQWGPPILSVEHIGVSSSFEKRPDNAAVVAPDLAIPCMHRQPAVSMEVTWQ